MSLFDPHLTATFTVRVRGHRFTDAEIKAIADRLAEAAMKGRKRGSAMVFDGTETFRSVWWGVDDQVERERAHRAAVEDGDA